MTAAESIESTAADLGLSMTAVFVPWSLSRNAGEKQPSLNWKVSLLKNGRKFLKTDYGAGQGHCPGYRQGDKSLCHADAVRFECERGREAAILPGGGITNKNARPLTPSFADVLHSLASDADALDCSDFGEWADNLGYDQDSRKAEAIYRACLDIGLKLRNALGDDGLRRLREACQDY